MSLHEECGLFGLFAPGEDNVAETVYYGLYALQHRGQEGCGITVCSDGLLYSHKDVGLVGDVFGQDVLSRFPKGSMAIGHVRYGTMGARNRKNCQPLEVNHQKGHMALAHNGNLSNAYRLRSELELSGAIFHTTSDTESIAYIITQERLSAPSIEEAVSRAMGRLEGAYSLLIMSPKKLIAVRDPHGFRPLCFGYWDDGSVVVASESCALDAVGATFCRDLDPGEMLVITKDGLNSRREHCQTQVKKSCIFEYIYFARPDSVIDGISVHEARLRAGACLAKCRPAEADVVVGVPDSGLSAALGFAREAHLPYEIGLVKNKYVGRTFIAPGQKQRIDKVKLKLSPVASAVRGKRVVLIDDSIVRGTTGARIVHLLREAGAREIHMRICAPPFLFPCYYGTDVSSKDALIASGSSEEEIARALGADSLSYLPREDLAVLAGGGGYCSACFDGDYPTRIPREDEKRPFDRRLSEV